MATDLNPVKTEVQEGENTIDETVKTEDSAVEDKPEETTEESQPKKKRVSNEAIAERLDKIETVLGKLLGRIDLNDKPVPVPVKKNHNPDYLPKHGGKPVTLADLPPKGL
jgi:hypothetical protein